MQKNVNNGQNGAATSAVKYNVVVKNNSIVFDVLDDAIDYVVMMIKDHPRDAIYVNGMVKVGRNVILGIVLKLETLQLYVKKD